MKIITKRFMVGLFLISLIAAGLTTQSQAADFIFEVPVKYTKLDSEVSHVSVTCHAQNKLFSPGVSGAILWGSKEVVKPVINSALVGERSFKKTVKVAVDVPANQLHDVHAYTCVTRVCKNQLCREMNNSVADNEFYKAKNGTRLVTFRKGSLD
jgi:hypothetical protein